MQDTFQPSASNPYDPSSLEGKNWNDLSFYDRTRLYLTGKVHSIFGHESPETKANEYLNRGGSPFINSMQTEGQVTGIGGEQKTDPSGEKNSLGRPIATEQDPAISSNEFTF